MSPVIFHDWYPCEIGRDYGQVGNVFAKCCCLNWHKSKISGLLQWVSPYPSVSKALLSNETNEIENSYINLYIKSYKLKIFAKPDFCFDNCDSVFTLRWESKTWLSSEFCNSRINLVLYRDSLIVGRILVYSFFKNSFSLLENGSAYVEVLSLNNCKRTAVPPALVEWRMTPFAFGAEEEESFLDLTNSLKLSLRILYSPSPCCSTYVQFYAEDGRR